MLILVLQGFSVGDACFCQILLTMLASAVDAGSAGGGPMVMLISASFC